MMWAIHPKSEAKARELLGLPDDVPLTIEDLHRAATIEAAQTPPPEPATLTDFLLARIAEDREAVNTAFLRLYARRKDVSWANQRWAECDARHAIVIMCGEYPDQAWDTEEADHLATRTLKFLAHPYKDHPDYHEEWKP